MKYKKGIEETPLTPHEAGKATSIATAGIGIYYSTMAIRCLSAVLSPA
jgi:hypothetical protein